MTRAPRKNRPKNSPTARFRGLRRDGTERWEGRISYPDPNSAKRIWHACSSDEHGRPFTTKTDAERWAAKAKANHLDGQHLATDGRRSGATFRHAAELWLRYVEHERGVKPSTLNGYRNVVEHWLLPRWGDEPLAAITTQKVERWKDTLIFSSRRKGQALSPRTRRKIITGMGQVMERARRVYGLPTNPVRDVELPRNRPSNDIDVFSPEEVWALVHAAARGAHRTPRSPAGGTSAKASALAQREAEDQLDAALYLTAAFAGLRRGELLALRWRDVDFAISTVRVRASYVDGSETLPKSGKVRSVPMVDEVATALAKLSHRTRYTGDDDLVFTVRGDHLDGSAVRRRYDATLRAAGLRPLRFHDLRHTFGSNAINRVSIVEVQTWMGHANITTTQKYLHYKQRGDEARRLAGAFDAAPETGILNPKVGVEDGLSETYSETANLPVNRGS